MTAPLDKITTILATALLAENDNEARNALAGVRAKLARAGIDIHRLRLSDDRNRSNDAVLDLSYNEYVAKLERAETMEKFWQRKAEEADRDKQEIALRSVHALRAEEDRRVKLQARIDKLMANRRTTVAQVRNTTEWVTQTRYTSREALEARHRLDQAVLRGTLSKASAAKHKAHIARRTV